MERHIPMLWVIGLVLLFVFAITSTYQIGYYRGSAAGFITGFKDRAMYYEKVLKSNGFYIKELDTQNDSESPEQSKVEEMP